MPCLPPRPAPQWLADQEFIHRDGRVWDALPRVATPCLIMNGDKDVLVRCACCAVARVFGSIFGLGMCRWQAAPLRHGPVLAEGRGIPCARPPSLQVPHENAERIAARIPGARLHTWHGWGHGFKDAARLAQAVNEFLLDG